MARTSIGRRLSHYEITAHLGSGGMGDVFQATDLMLGRDVALKFLPETLASDPGRAARFAREAKVLALLNHPNIAAIYALEQAEGRSFLVMELVPGETLADRIRVRALPVAEALDVARQIAEALEVAHGKGVVHRDLKPANVKVVPGDRVKVLDFGLAKLAADSGESTSDESTATLIPAGDPITRAGAAPGTAGYMAPEQARAGLVDRRADIFALGCLLFEMLTGRRAFAGDSAVERLASVLERDPDWALLPSSVPPSVRSLLRLCLEKDPKKRRQSAGDVRIDLEQCLAGLDVAEPTAGPPRSWVRRMAWATAVAVPLGIAAIPAVIQFRETPPPQLRLEIVTPPSQDPQSFAVSPDGRSIVYAASGESGGRSRLYVRALSEGEAHPIPGTEGARFPFWSPNGRSIGFFASRILYRVDIAGGAPVALAPASNPSGGSWNADGAILFAPNAVSPLSRVPASGGAVVAATALEAKSQINHAWPRFLPDGHRFLFHVAGAPDVAGLYLGSLDGGATTRLTAAEAGGAFLEPDRIVFVQRGTLVARRFDAARRMLTGEAETLAPSVGMFSVSASGVIAHRAQSSGQPQLLWYDRTGTLLGRLGNIMGIGPELSPDDGRLALDRTTADGRDVWLMDLVRGGLTRLTADATVDGYPVWSPDGSRIAFGSGRNGTPDLWVKASDGTGGDELLFGSPDSEWPLQWSKDDRYLLYQQSDLGTTWNLWALPMTGSDRTPIAVATTAFAERMGEISPDSRWVAYETDESGRPEITVQAFPRPGARWAVSTDGGAAPRWSPDGREIYFVDPSGRMMAAPVGVKGSEMEIEVPVPLFATRIMPQLFKSQYAVTHDGRFLISSLPAEVPTPPIHLIVNVRP